ncbi:MAG: hypothetical protein ACRD2L_06845 [Terriglobia bacterium]
MSKIDAAILKKLQRYDRLLVNALMNHHDGGYNFGDPDADVSCFLCEVHPSDNENDPDHDHWLQISDYDDFQFACPACARHVLIYFGEHLASMIRDVQIDRQNLGEYLQTRGQLELFPKDPE